MYFTNDIQKYIVFSEDSILDVLKKISANRSRVAFVISEHAELLGSVSDGDIRRWLIEEEDFKYDTSINKIMNPNCKMANLSDDKSLYSSFFTDGVDCIPLVDDARHLVQLVFKGLEGFYIGDREISNNSPAYIIAEIGNNHQGDIKLAKLLVDHALAAGADCAKFQMRNLKQLYKNEGNTNDASTDLGAQYTLDLLTKFQLGTEELFETFDYCKKQGITPLCTPWDKTSLEVLEKYGMPAYKVASADFTNFELLEAIANTGKPILCSTGMSTETEIKSTVAYLDSLTANYVLLHCNSTYPTPYKDVNLKYLSRLKNITGKLVGYSGHERGISIPIVAIALGACVVEKHLTIDPTLEGNDHKVSLLPDEFKEMIDQIRNVEESMGSDQHPREITQGEMINRENLAKSLVAKLKIYRDEVITRDMIAVKSPGQGVQPNRIDDLVGKKANRNIEQGGFFYDSDINGVIEKRSDYKFGRAFGVPVRYHDYREIVKNSNLDFVEFHLSYKDLELDLGHFFNSEEILGFAVHSPELFSGDHILDLCATDHSYRRRSIKELRRVVEVTRELKKFFPKTEKPIIVVNAGGWNPKGFIEPELKPLLYEKIAHSFKEIDLTGVQIAIQTMPPFPWHFGGQSYHNLFVAANEIQEFCRENPELKICLDISHSMMACNYYGWDLLEFVEIIAPFNVHMHIVDAKGVDGEGVEIGKGNVDFRALAKLLNKVNKSVQFIPEVWQGHKNGGEGFWKALDYLEKYF
jgi:N-acetylneuraminate synthase